MKKTAMTLLACAALGVAYGQEEQQKSGFGLELNAAYNFALKDIVKAEDGVPAYSVNTYGVDLTAVYTINKHHAVNIRFGYTTGDDEHTLYGYDYDDEFVSERIKVELQNIYIMPGYRLTTSLNDSLSFFGGVNVGFAQTKGKIEDNFLGETYTESKSKWGFAWSVEVGVAQKITNTGSVTLAVQLQGLYGRPQFNELYEGKPETQLNLGVRLGYSCQF